jgi:hypothetical protein
MNKEHLHPDGRPYTKEEFVEKIKTDKTFANIRYDCLTNNNKVIVRVS